MACSTTALVALQSGRARLLLLLQTLPCLHLGLLLLNCVLSSFLIVHGVVRLLLSLILSLLLSISQIAVV